MVIVMVIVRVYLSKLKYIYTPCFQKTTCKEKSLAITGYTPPYGENGKENTQHLVEWLICHPYQTSLFPQAHYKQSPYKYIQPSIRYVVGFPFLTSFFELKYENMDIYH